MKAGQVQKKNNWEETPFYDISEQPELVIDRVRPGNGYRHLFTQVELRRFISIVPDWSEYSRGLNAVVLSRGRADAFGYYYPGVISLFAWTLDNSVLVDESCYTKRTWLLEQLGVLCLPEGNGDWTLHFDEDQARAYLLLGTFLHELGHHNDYMNTRSPQNANRGERYAEEFALRLGLQLWPKYQKVFSL